MLNRASFRKELQDGLNAVFGKEYKRYQQEWTAIFDVSNSNKAFEEEVLATGFGAAAVKPEGASILFDDASDGYVARYVHETIALGFSITEEAEEDGLYGSLGARYARALATSMVHTKEVKGANILNNGFTAAFPGGDGVELFSTAHPLAGGGTLSNELATPADLSEAALEEATIQIAGWTDERGIPVALQPVKLIIPKELCFVAERILMSTYRPGTADNDVNALKSKGVLPQGYSENHRLTDPDAWFLKTDCPDGLKHFVRKKIARGMEGDFLTGNMRYKSRERYSFGWSNWRGAFGSAGSGS